MEEEWKDIPNYEGLYQASNLGKIRALTFHNNVCFKKRIHLLKQQIDKYNRKRITLQKEGKVKTFQVHTLIAITFLNKNNFKSLPTEDINSIALDNLEINHKDENPLNNCVDNLEWCTHLYNMQYGTGIIRNGIKHRKKINQYDLNGNLIRTWNSITEASNALKISQQIINMCCKEKIKIGKGYRWKYAK